MRTPTLTITALFVLIARLFAGEGTDTTAVSAAPGETGNQPRNELVEHKPKKDRWSVEFGVGVIAASEPSDYAALKFESWDRPGHGLTYNFTVGYVLWEFDWKVWGSHLRPQIEIPAMLTLVDESELSLFPDYNLGIRFRWQDWPWSRWLYTSFALGAGMSYSAKVWTADRLKHHPGAERSHLKFWLPLELTIAIPKYRQHQLVLFADHQSGGHCLLDCGGVDACGFGYRFLF
jgi:hypothetical protein